MLLPPFNLPEHIFLLITDTLPSPGSFLLHQALADHIKSRSDSSSRPKKATIISVSEDIARWKAIAARFSINFGQHIDTGSITFVDALSLVAPPSSTSPQQGVTEAQTPLWPVFESVVASLSSGNENGSDHLVILDDITTLEWIGFPLLSVSRFIRALVAACRKVDATLIVRHHLTLSDEIDDLFRCLLQLSVYHLEVRSLASGRSGAVSGEIALHAGPSTSPSQVKLLSRSSALQYRLTDSGSVFFERGTGPTVL